MCGICCIFTRKCVVEIEDAICRCRLQHRGPDVSSTKAVCLSDGCSAVFSGHVLHLRGLVPVSQPTQHSQTGNQLLWNGEIYDGITVAENENDTLVLLDLLSSDDVTDDIIINTMATIHGPWAFIFWQASSETLWFGRDVFGRRSLLWHLPQTQDDDFLLSSVQINTWTFTEIPAIGIYKMTRQVIADSSCDYHVTLYPWERAVWPGTLDPVNNDVDMSTKISSDQPVDTVMFMYGDTNVPSQMSPLNKDLPPDTQNLQSLAEGQTHIDYLKNVVESNEYLRCLAHQLAEVLLQAVKVRVFNQPRPRSTRTDHSKNTKTLSNLEIQDQPVDKCEEVDNTASLSLVTASFETHQSSSSVAEDKVMHDGTGSDVSHDQSVLLSDARVAILFSGGIDCTVIAALADRCVPAEETIDLINVSFEMKKKETGKKKRPPDEPIQNKWDVPDRLTGYTALSELNPDRSWNFIEVNVTAEELNEARQHHIQELLYPLQTVLDDSIGCAVWFAARGSGTLGNGPNKGRSLQSTAKVILCGMGADEQLVGYSRHRGRFKQDGWPGLIDEIELDVTRISTRNLGRDDRIITDHGKESRFPYLDEKVVRFLSGTRSGLPVHEKVCFLSGLPVHEKVCFLSGLPVHEKVCFLSGLPVHEKVCFLSGLPVHEKVCFLSGLPVHEKADLTLPRGLGEKFLLRLCATVMGLHQTATLPKRAIQFGSRIAKMENSKEKASDKCDRLTYNRGAVG